MPVWGRPTVLTATCDGLKEIDNPVDADLRDARDPRARGAPRRRHPEGDLRLQPRRLVRRFRRPCARARSWPAVEFVASLTGPHAGRSRSTRAPARGPGRPAGRGRGRRETPRSSSSPQQERARMDLRRCWADAVDDGRIVRMARLSAWQVQIQLQDPDGTPDLTRAWARSPRCTRRRGRRKTTKAKTATELQLPKADAAPTDAASATTAAPRRPPRWGPRKRRRRQAPCVVRTPASAVLAGRRARQQRCSPCPRAERPPPAAW